MFARYTYPAAQVTHTVLVTPQQLRRICPEAASASLSATPFRRLIRDLLLFFESTYQARRYSRAAAPILLSPEGGSRRLRYV